jgi:uncharacterized protein YecE (DUF72 family)
VVETIERPRLPGTAWFVRIWLGTSGWQYRDWRGRFYPTDLPQSQWLEHHASAFGTVELNNSFYRLPSTAQFEAWTRRTPDDYAFAVKASRYLTHVKRLADADEPVDLFVERARGLGAKLGPVLVQLPPTLKAVPERLDQVLGRFGRHRVRVAVEPRHETWFTDETYALLRSHGAALVLADRKSRRSPVVTTADWAFVRLHEGTASPWPRYGDAALASWASTIADLPVREAWVFFNNDPGCWAVANARTFGRACERLGLDVSRYPADPVPAAGRAA